MAQYSEEERELHKAIVRRIMTFEPNITALAMRERLAKSDRPLELTTSYITTLGKEIMSDRVREINDETKESIMGAMNDLVDFANQNLRAIAQEEKLVYQKTKDGVPVESAEVRIFAQNNRIKALNSIVMNYKTLVNLKMDLGLMKRDSGTLNVRVLDMLAAIKLTKNGSTGTLGQTVRDAQLVGGGK